MNSSATITAKARVRRGITSSQKLSSKATVSPAPTRQSQG
jgi:hypothetical protein